MHRFFSATDRVRDPCSIRRFCNSVFAAEDLVEVGPEEYESMIEDQVAAIAAAIGRGPRSSKRTSQTRTAWRSMGKVPWA